ncbi:unnamed protein product [Brassica oleracea var. botrytis]
MFVLVSKRIAVFIKDDMTRDVHSSSGRKKAYVSFVERIVPQEHA